MPTRPARSAKRSATKETRRSKEVEPKDAEPNSDHIYQNPVVKRIANWRTCHRPDWSIVLRAIENEAVIVVLDNFEILAKDRSKDCPSHVQAQEDSDVVSSRLSLQPIITFLPSSRCPLPRITSGCKL